MAVAHIETATEIAEVIAEPEQSAVAAGLNYVSDAAPGILRRRRGRGFSYHYAGGRTVKDEPTLERIRALAIPPAWTDVWISGDPLGHLQATGRDTRGRKQYRYHSTWRSIRDENKYAALRSFGHALPLVRERVDIDLRRKGLPREKVLAVVTRLLDETLIRVGNKEYADDNESYGLTTITPEHAEVGWSTMSFDFVGKGGAEHHVRVDDGRLARVVRRCHELGGQTLFSYRDVDQQRISSLSSADVNDYLRETTGTSVTAKHFRTWGGTKVAAEHLASLEPPTDAQDAESHILDAVDSAAEQLRNTRAVCRSSYVHPAVLDAYRDGTLGEYWKWARSVGRLDRAERTVLAILDETMADADARSSPGA